jgi:hypothetical protein
MTQPTTKLSISSISILPTTANISPGIRRVRFKFDEHDRNQIRKDFNNHRHTRSFDDVSLSENNSRHRVEVEIPIYKGIKSIKYQLYHICYFCFVFFYYLRY